MRIDCEQQIDLTVKPKGSAYVAVTVRVAHTSKTVKADICVDTGADITICTSAFVINLFGVNVLKHIMPLKNPPRLRSATGHRLVIKGRINLLIGIGTYLLDTWVLVQDSGANVFLLGSDNFYNRLIYDRGKYITFADGKHQPVPIHYKLENSTAKAAQEYSVAPRSSALIAIKVTGNNQLVGKEVILSPIKDWSDSSTRSGADTDITRWWTGEHDASCLAMTESPILDTVSIIDPSGYAQVMVRNVTEDILVISPESELVKVNLVSEENADHCIYYIDSSGQVEANQTTWAATTLNDEQFKGRLPPNVHIRWENLNDQPAGDCLNVHYVHDKDERKQLLDGTGEGFPTPPAPEPTSKEQLGTPSDPEAWLNSVEHSHLSDDKWIKLRDMLLENKEAFSKTKTEVGCCRYFKADLPLKPGTGYLYNKPRPLPHKHKEIAAKTISELLEQGIIRPSKSPHATNIVVVKKKTMNGVVSFRVCCDLRQVNEHSIPNRFPNYQVEDAMAKIQGSALRTAMDFKNAFHQILLNEESIPVTAFYFNNVLYEYVRVPFGHVCAMNIFCCLMALLCQGYDASSYYADDLMITTKTDPHLNEDQIFDLHLEHIDGMLKRIIDAGLKLVAHKCQWCYDAAKPMEWLGFTLENNLLKPQESKVKVIKEYPVPVSAKQAISFVSLASFYRRFVKSFAKIAKPIYEAANAEVFAWTEAADIAFNELKRIMCSEPVLRMPRQGEPFHMYSDASHGALGVVLCQKDPIDGHLHPCAYGSRKFNDAELKLSTPCKELLAIVYGLNLWSFYICGNPIYIYSDCRAWTFLKVQTGVSGKISRLALLVSEYDITVSFVQGVKNKAADGLSRAFDTGEVLCDDQATARHPALEHLHAPELSDGQTMRLNDYLDVCDGYLKEHWPRVLKDYESKQGKVDTSQIKEANHVDKTIHEASILHIDRISQSKWKKYELAKDKPFYNIDDTLIVNSYDEDSDDDSYPSSVETPFSDGPNTTDSSFKAARYNIRTIIINDHCFTFEAFRGAQEEDEFCGKKMEELAKKNPATIKAKYFKKKGILMRELSTKDGQIIQVVCVPASLVGPLLDSTHRYLLNGHHGSSKYYLDMTRKYYWPNMKTDIDEYHRACIPCQFNDKYPVKYPLGNVIKPLWPMHIVHCDLMVGLPKSKDGSHAILLLYDGFSRFTFGVALTSEKADYIVKKMLSHYVAAFGLPWALHSDNGKNIDGNLVRQLALLLGVIKTSTPPHTPNANPCETMCGAVAMLLRKGLNASDRKYWPLCLPFVLNALNSTTHTATGYTPNSLFFGRYREKPLVPLVPFDAEASNVNEYYQKMRRFQELSFQIARVRNAKKIQARKIQWDKTARKPRFEEGDFVLIKNNNPASGPGKLKLRAKYLGPFRIIKVYPSSVIVVPWSECSKLDEHNRKPDLLRLMNRGDIRPFHPRMVSIKHCKPFHGEKQLTENIIDPVMLSKFLDDLDVNCDGELESVIDSSEGSLSTIDSEIDRLPKLGPTPRKKHRKSGNDGDDSSGPSVPGYRGPIPDLVAQPASSGAQSSNDPADQNDSSSDPPSDGDPAHDQQSDAGDDAAGDDQDDYHSVDSAEHSQEQEDSDSTDSQVEDEPDEQEENQQPVDRLLHNLDLTVTERQRELMRAKYQAQVDDAGSETGTFSNKVRDLEQLIRSPDRNVREQAQEELGALLEELEGEPADSPASSSGSDSSHGLLDRDRLELSGLSLDQTMDWDDEFATPRGAARAPARAEAQEVNIQLPGCRVNIQPAGRRMDGPSTSTPRGGGPERTADWVSRASPIHGGDYHEDDPARVPGPDTVPYTTRSGRLTRSPVSYQKPEQPAVRPEVAGPSDKPFVTRAGRVPRTPQKFDPLAEENRQKEARNAQKALNKSKAEAKAAEAEAKAKDDVLKAKAGDSTEEKPKQAEGPKRSIPVPTFHTGGRQIKPSPSAKVLFPAGASGIGKDPHSLKPSPEQARSRADTRRSYSAKRGSKSKSPGAMPTIGEADPLPGDDPGAKASEAGPSGVPRQGSEAEKSIFAKSTKTAR